MGVLLSSTLASDYLAGVASTDTATTAILARALVRAESQVAVHLGYPGLSATLESTSYTLRLRGSRIEPKRLLIPVAPVTAVASVYQDLDLAFGSGTLINSGDYEREDLRCGSYLNLLPTGQTSTWFTAERSIKVTCTAGYADEAAMPTVLADAIYRIVADWWLRRTNRHLGSISAGGQNQSVLDLKDANPDALAILEKFRILGSVGIS